MPERRNQHYVPIHLLRAWASDESLKTLHLNSEKVFEENMSSVCSRNYFYGNPPVVEKELAHLESYHARPINQLRDGRNLTDLTDQHAKLLRSFVTTQRIRTRSFRLDIEAAGSDSLRESVKEDMNNDGHEGWLTWKSNLTKGEKEDTLVDAYLLGTHHRLMVQGIFGHIGTEDLHGVMLHNATTREFIISDAPVVHDNPRYKDKYGLIKAGLANKGLQIFCPIDRDRILLLYDPKVYSFNNNTQRQIFIKSTDVVDQLNLLQLHNAESIVMFDSCKNEYIEDMLSHIDEVGRRETIVDNSRGDSGETEGVEYVPRCQMPAFSPKLPNVTTTTHLNYVQQRQSSRIQKQRNFVRAILSRAHQGSDVALIYSIRLLKERLSL